MGDPMPPALPPIGFSAVIAPIIFAAVVAAVIFLVVRPTHVHIRGHRLHLHYCWVPCVGVLLMLICQSLTWAQVGAGIRGDEHIQPLALLVLFMSLAYIAGSLDMTGLFAWLALKLTLYSKGDGRLLFFLYFALSSVTTLLTSNDVSIMCLTPIICYFAAAARVDPVPYLIAEFLPANILSMALFIGNPTNIIVAQAYHMTFLGYAGWMVLPTLGSSLVCLAVLWFQFRHSLPLQLQLPAVHPSVLLTDRRGAWLGCAILTVCLVLLAVAPTLNWHMWLITLACAMVHATYNFWAMGGWFKAFRQSPPRKERLSSRLAELEMQLRERWGRRRRRVSDSDTEERSTKASGEWRGRGAEGAQRSRAESPERNTEMVALLVQPPASPPRLSRGHISPSTISFMSDDAPDPSTLDLGPSGYGPNGPGPSYLPAPGQRPAWLQQRQSAGGASMPEHGMTPGSGRASAGGGAAAGGSGAAVLPPTAESLALLNLSPFEMLSIEASFGPDALAAAADAALKAAAPSSSVSSLEGLAALHGSSSWSFEEVSRWLQQQRQETLGQGQGSGEIGTPRLGTAAAPSPLSRSPLSRSVAGPGPVAEGVEDQGGSQLQGNAKQGQGQQGQGQGVSWSGQTPFGASPFASGPCPGSSRLLGVGSMRSDSQGGASGMGPHKGAGASHLGNGTLAHQSAAGSASHLSSGALAHQSVEAAWAAAPNSNGAGPSSSRGASSGTLGGVGTASQRRWVPPSPPSSVTSPASSRPTTPRAAPASPPRPVVGPLSGHALRTEREADSDGERDEQRRLLHPSSLLLASHVQLDGGVQSADAALLAGLKPQEPSFLATFSCLPWAVVPFALGFFVLVEGLYVQGWVQRIATGLGSAASAGLGPALLLIGSLSIAASNLMNNQPMTVLFTEVLLDPAFGAAAGPAAHHASLFALIIGSNLGANFTLIGALAGIMWVTIIRDRGIVMSYARFFKLVWLPGLATSIAALLILWAEFAVMT